MNLEAYFRAAKAAGATGFKVEITSVTDVSVKCTLTAMAVSAPPYEFQVFDDRVFLDLSNQAPLKADE